MPANWSPLKVRRGGINRGLKQQHKADVIELKMASKLPFIEDEQDKVLCGTCFCPSPKSERCMQQISGKLMKNYSLALYSNMLP